jgi:hypothetical protein
MNDATHIDTLTDALIDRLWPCICDKCRKVPHSPYATPARGFHLYVVKPVGGAVYGRTDCIRDARKEVRDLDKRGRYMSVWICTASRPDGDRIV